MSRPTYLQIEAYEERLRQAMLKSDLSALDELLAPDLIFTNHLGHLMTKNDDLEAHKSGALKIDEIKLSDQVVKVSGNVAVVSVQAYIAGKFGGEASESSIRFTRVWSKVSSERWQVIAGHSSLVA